MKNYLIINEFYSSESFNKIYQALKNAFLARGEDLEILTNVQATRLLNEEGNNQPILFFDKDVYLARLLQKSGYRCVNSPFVIEICDDKAKTYIELKGKFDQPKTILAPFSYDGVECNGIYFLEEDLNSLGFPLIVKQNKGSFGQQVYLVNDISELQDLVNSFGHTQYLMQRLITSSLGKDLRVYVVGGKAVAYALRYNEKDFRSNVGAGGKMKRTEVDKAYLETAVEVCNYLGADFAGVDLLFGENGPIVCEVNSNAHFLELSKISGVDIAGCIVDYYLSLKK
ncbi:MAG: RimK family alpha-L-glutamate ligase [Clostridiales bacterium]|nr:RimK family alpha-L-glutamate ligase [Clostridiales bacterium]